MARDYVGELQGNSGKSQDQQNNNQGMFTGFLQKAGLSNIPILGGVLNNIARGGEYAAEGGLAGLQLAGNATGVRPLQSSDAKPTFMSPADAQTLTPNQTPGKGLLDLPQEAVNTAGKVGLSAGADVTGLTGAPGVISNLAQIVPTAGKILTGKGAWEGIVDAAKNTPSWQNVKTNALVDAANQPAPVRAALEEVLSKEIPNLARGGATDAVEQRAGIGQSIPKNFWGQSNIDSAQSRAYAIYRNALSRELKSSNPDLTAADKIYGINQNIKGAIPGVLKTAGVGGGVLTAGNFLKDLLSGVSKDNSAP